MHMIYITNALLSCVLGSPGWAHILLLFTSLDTCRPGRIRSRKDGCLIADQARRRGLHGHRAHRADCPAMWCHAEESLLQSYVGMHLLLLHGPIMCGVLLSSSFCFLQDLKIARHADRDWAGADLQQAFWGPLWNPHDPPALLLPCISSSPCLHA